MKQPFIRSAVCAGLFLFLLVFILIENKQAISFCVVFYGLLFWAGGRQVKNVVLTSLVFGIGFSAYLYGSSHLIPNGYTRETELFLKRASLLLVLLPLAFLSYWDKQPFMSFWRKAEWNQAFYLPLHQTTVKRFLWIAITVNSLVFLPFISENGWLYVQDMFWLALVFSFTNALLEEWIWRGALLGRFAVLIGEKGAVWLTSMGFGLQHYSLGFSWPVCFAFAIGGLFYGVLTIQSKSIFPAMIWHFALNMLMVWSGMLEKGN